MSKVKRKRTLVGQYLDKIFEAIEETQSEVDGASTPFFRGHGGARFELKPSIYRDENKKYLENEDRIYSDIMSLNPGDFSADRSMLDKLARMQHFGLPTRMLDMTSNPLIALYFACEGRIDEKDAPSHVVVASVADRSTKPFDSDTATCLANLTRLDTHQKEKVEQYIRTSSIIRVNTYAKIIKKKGDGRIQQEYAAAGAEKKCVDYFRKWDEVTSLVHFCREEKPYFRSCIKPKDLQKVLFVRSRMNNERLKMQSGAFFLFGLGEKVIPDGCTDDKTVYTTKVTIEYKDRKTLIKELRLLNIHKGTVFPHISSSADYIKEKFG